MDTTNAQALLHSEALLLKGEVARILRCSPRTVERNWQEWGLSELHLTDGSVRFPAQDVERFIRERASSQN